jgi:hypothetical protein
MAAPHGATLDQAGCVRTSASASHNPYSASGSGTGKTINFRDQKPIGKRDPAQTALVSISCRSARSLQRAPVWRDGV